MDVTTFRPIPEILKRSFENLNFKINFAGTVPANIYIYIYIYISLKNLIVLVRERERERERERGPNQLFERVN